MLTKGFGAELSRLQLHQTTAIWHYYAREHIFVLQTSWTFHSNKSRTFHILFYKCKLSFVWVFVSIVIVTTHILAQSEHPWKLTKQTSARSVAYLWAGQ